MRTSLLVFSLLVASVACAQEAEPAGPPGELNHAFAQYAARLTRLSADIKRDAFIVAQVALAAGELQDFQQSVAIQKAIDLITTAQVRAGQQPPAPASIAGALNELHETLVHARDSGAGADMDALRTDVLRRASRLQAYLFYEVRGARNERMMLTELQHRAAEVGGQLDDALVDALGAAFDTARAGAK